MAAQSATFPRLPVVRLLALIVLIGAAGLRGSLASQGIRSEEMWWHLSTGLWILQHHALPHDGVLSLSSNLPWVDATWGFDLLLAATYKLLGLRAIAFATAVVRMLFAVSVYLVAGGRRNFWLSFGLAGLAQVVFPDMLPLPISLSMTLFALEVALLVHWRETADAKILNLLPLIFAIWSNVHSPFAIGIVALALFLLCTAAQNWLAERGLGFPASPSLSPRLLIVSFLSVLATAANPYGARVWAQVLPSSYSSVAFGRFGDLEPLGFRQPQDYLLVLLAMCAFLLLGRNRTRSLFDIVLLAVTLCVAFRIQRDAWLLAVAAVFVTGHCRRALGPAVEVPVASKWQTPAAAVAALLLMIAVVSAAPSQQETMSNTAEVEPVKACDFIRANRLPQPLFNSMEWGGFLTWYLPEYPVTIDSRINLYGNDTVEQYFKIVNGGLRLDTAPMFADAQTMLVAKGSALERALSSFPDLAQRYS